MFVATSILLSRQKTCFAATKMILVAAPANDSLTELLSRPHLESLMGLLSCHSWRVEGWGGGGGGGGGGWQSGAGACQFALDAHINVPRLLQCVQHRLRFRAVLVFLPTSSLITSANWL